MFWRDIYLSMCRMNIHCRAVMCRIVSCYVSLLSHSCLTRSNLLLCTTPPKSRTVVAPHVASPHTKLSYRARGVSAVTNLWLMVHIWHRISSLTNYKTPNRPTTSPYNRHHQTTTLFHPTISGLSVGHGLQLIQAVLLPMHKTPTLLHISHIVVCRLYNSPLAATHGNTRQ